MYGGQINAQGYDSRFDTRWPDSEAISESNAFPLVWDFLMTNKRSHLSEFC